MGEIPEVSQETWTDVLADTDLKDGGVKGIKVRGSHVAFYKIDGGIFATSDVCSHEFALLSGGWLEGDEIECPLHGARFKIKDGRCLGPLAHEDIKSYSVRLRDGRIEVLIASSPGD